MRRPLDSRILSALIRKDRLSRSNPVYRTEDILSFLLDPLVWGVDYSHTNDIYVRKKVGHLMALVRYLYPLVNVVTRVCCNMAVGFVLRPQKQQYLCQSLVEMIGIQIVCA